ncbi:hypothetical protein SEPCBS119000_000647 [Sporothrix epigloea]|uniref:Ima1 N-terminal domain-containing protein n=1 Tax=Sporothrix epigloea TaxID=1892477 RepID=A0ABP0D971_9PEZI
MVRLRRTRYLSCFYCGRRSSIAYNDAIREFTCANCDATNYLDEETQNGEITDPPLSSTSALESTGPFFASGPESFRSSPSNADQGSPGGETAVFCKTCLKNQHLFISSLAQYFPSDPDDPDTAELDRRYFRFRQGLEQRYPQVCADCEPRVLDRIREARYTAKTDHLRRMVDYSRQVRLTRATPIDAANWAGQKLWWAGLVLQILWQTGVIGSFLRRTMIAPAVDAEDLGVVLAKVAGSPSMADESTDFAAASLPPTVAGAHTVAALLTLYLYTVAPRVIRKDLRPLFSKVPETSVTPQEASKSAERQRKLSESQRHDLGSISDVLDEIASEPPQRHVQSSLQEYRVNNSDGRDRWQSSHIGSSGSRTNRLEIGTNSDRAEAAGRPWLAGIASSSMSSHGGYASTAPASQPRQTWSQQQDDYTSADADEMDWTPTQPSLQPEMQSPHRAFNTFQTDRSHIGQRPASANAFAQTSVATNPGPFWYKVPPTPTNVAQNILKRQNVPWFAQEDSRNNGGNDSLQAASFFSPKGDANSRRTLNFDAQSLAGASSSVEFAPPSFFAEDLQTKAKKKENGQNTQRADDPGSLSDLFSQTFSLDAGDGRDEDDDAHHEAEAGKGGVKYPTQAPAPDAIVNDYYQ